MNGKVKTLDGKRTRKTIASAVAGVILAATVGACSVASGATIRGGSLDRPAGVGPAAAPAPVLMDESYNSLGQQYAKAKAPKAVVMDESFQSLSQQYAKAQTSWLSSTGAAHKESNRQADHNR